MTDTSIFTKILLILIILHFIVGFGYLIYKLSPRKKEDEAKDDSTQE